MLGQNPLDGFTMKFKTSSPSTSAEKVTHLTHQDYRRAQDFIDYYNVHHPPTPLGVGVCVETPICYSHRTPQGDALTFPPVVCEKECTLFGEQCPNQPESFLLEYKWQRPRRGEAWVATLLKIASGCVPIRPSVSRDSDCEQIGLH